MGPLRGGHINNFSSRAGAYSRGFLIRETKSRIYGILNVALNLSTKVGVFESYENLVPLIY